MPNTVQLTKNGQEIYPVTHESLVVGLNKRAYDSQNPNGMGYLVLEKDKTFTEQVTKANTIYEIRHNFVIEDDFQIPNNCVLKFVGGSIDGEVTIDLNNCQISGANEWIGEDLTLSGKTSTPCYADWFADAEDYKKIERAIATFGVVNLNARDYIITAPVNISVPFALFGCSIPANFGTNSATQLIASQQIDCILNITKGSTFISASIQNVSFTASSDYYGLVNGINFNTPNGPSRPFAIYACNFKRLKYGLYIYFTDDSKSTNLYNLSIKSSNLSVNKWAIYIEGLHSLGGCTIEDCTIEQNTYGGIYANANEGTDYIPIMGMLAIRNNLLEGQPDPIKIYTAGAVIIEGNYFESSNAQTVTVRSNSTNSISPVVIRGNNHSNSGVSNFTYDISGGFITELSDTGSLGFNVSLSSCMLYNTRIDERIKITSCHRVYIISSEEDSTNVDTPVFTAPITPNIIADGVPSLRSPSSWASPDAYRNYTASWPAGTYRMVFYMINDSANNTVYIRSTTSDTVDYGFSLFNPRMNSIVKCVHDVTFENAQSGTNKFAFGYNPRGGEDTIMGSGLLVFAKGNTIPATRLSKITTRTYELANIKNAANGDKFYYPTVKKNVMFNGTNFVTEDGFTPALSVGDTASRPTLASTDAGFQYFDTDFGKMIVWNGSAWVNMDGTALS